MKIVRSRRTVVGTLAVLGLTVSLLGLGAGAATGTVNQGRDGGGGSGHSGPGRAQPALEASFEGRITTAVDAAGCTDTQCLQTFSGRDSSTGFRYDRSTLGGRLVSVLRPGSGTTPENVTTTMSSTLVRVTGACSRNTTALQNTVLTRASTGAGNSLALTRVNDASRFTTRLWVRLPGDYLERLGRYGQSELAGFTVPSSGAGFAGLGVYANVDEVGKPYWRLKATDSAGAELWYISNHDKTIPVGEWFQLQVSVDRGMNARGGSVRVSANGVPLFDEQRRDLGGARHASALSTLTLFANTSAAQPVTALVDDVKVWTGAEPPRERNCKTGKLAAVPQEPAASGRPDAPVGTKAIDASFEGDLSLRIAGDECGDISCPQYIDGIDAETGFDYASTPLGGRPYFHLIAGSPATPESIPERMNNALVNMTGHDGAPTTALESEVTARTVGPAQNALQIMPTEDPQQLYTRYWVKLSPDYLTRMGNYGWSVMGEFKTVQDAPDTVSRVIWYLYTDIDGVPFWHLKADNNATGEYPTVDTWYASNRDVPVKVGEWFLVETYFDRGTAGASDGEAWVAIDGQTVFHEENVQLRGTAGNPLWVIMPWNNYAGSDGTVAWYDDFQLWTGGMPPA